MENTNKKHLVLIYIPPILCASMLLLMPILTNIFGKTVGYIAGFCFYWFIFCLPTCLYICDGFTELKTIYSQKSSVKKVERSIWYIVGFMPCLATFLFVFKQFALIAGFRVLTIALLYALINGTLEEMFWRGAFNKAFKNKMFLAYIYPTIFFGIWHISLFFAKGIEYQGGFASLVGGSIFMGFLWGWVAFKTKSIKVVTAAHIISNFFAFTGLIYENWFM